MTEPVQIVHAQMEAFNRHDLDGFLEHISVDVAVEDAEGHELVRGRGALRETISSMFADHPDLKSDLLDRISLGEWVIDETMLLGHADGSSTHVITIIRVRDGQVVSIRAIRE